MDSNYIKQTNKRFVIEDSFTKVTSDGEPHEMMTLIAGLSGLVAAIAVLIVLVSLVSCKKDKSVKHCKDCPSRAGSMSKSLENVATCYTPNDLEAAAIRTVSRFSSVSTISEGSNLQGNLNNAFLGSELSLIGKPKKATGVVSGKTVPEDAENKDDTVIQVERF